MSSKNVDSILSENDDSILSENDDSILSEKFIHKISGNDKIFYREYSENKSKYSSIKEFIDSKLKK